MSSTTPSSYDEVPYALHPFAQSHPDRLAAVATLLGLGPAPVERCRVLELGCAGGGNLIPMAEELPGSSFVGVERSERQVAEGRRWAEALGLRNLELRQQDIRAIGPDLGPFDYIIAHGVFSWVPPDVQDKLLAVCRDHLAPNGVAYVSYNTLPGWHMRGMIRDMMLFHSRQDPGPTRQAGRARALLDFLARSVQAEDNPYGQFLRSELEVLRHEPDSYLLHDHLEEHNIPVYFYQFVERAAAHGLRYLAEADLHVMMPAHFPPEVRDFLQQAADDPIHVEQYMDFLRNRMFRQTLLCRADRKPNYRLNPQRLSGFHVAAAVRPGSVNPDLRSAAYEQFHTTVGLTITSREPIVKAALMILAEAWPGAIPFAPLVVRARAWLDGRPVEESALAQRDQQQLALALFQFYTGAKGIVELRTSPTRFAARPGPRPLARRLARRQAEQGLPATNRRHELVRLGDFERQVFIRLDGQHDRAALIGELAGLGLGEPGGADGSVRVEEALGLFARNALLLE